MTNSKWFFLLTLLLVIIIPSTGCSKSEKAASAGEEGKSAPVAAPSASSAKTPPPFDLPDTKGNRIRLSDYKGKVVVLDFWATWCPPCREAIPHLSELQENMKSKGVAVLGMNLDQNASDLDSFLRAKPAGYTIVRTDQATSAAYRISGIPRIFVIDRQGGLRGDFLGFDRSTAKKIDALVAFLASE